MVMVVPQRFDEGIDQSDRSQHPGRPLRMQPAFLKTVFEPRWTVRLASRRHPVAYVACYAETEHHCEI